MALTVGFNKREKIVPSALCEMYESIPVVYTWNVQNKYDCFATTVEYISADGDELAYIERWFKNLPICPEFSVWEGEMANFIHANLKHLTK